MDRSVLDLWVGVFVAAGIAKPKTGKPALERRERHMVFEESGDSLIARKPRLFSCARIERLRALDPARGAVPDDEERGRGGREHLPFPRELRAGGRNLFDIADPDYRRLHANARVLLRATQVLAVESHSGRDRRLLALRAAMPSDETVRHESRLTENGRKNRQRDRAQHSRLTRAVIAEEQRDVRQPAVRPGGLAGNERDVRGLEAAELPDVQRVDVHG